MQPKPDWSFEDWFAATPIPIKHSELEPGMQTVNVSGLQSNPSKSHKGAVVMLHREKPHALMV